MRTFTHSHSFVYAHACEHACTHTSARRRARLNASIHTCKHMRMVACAYDCEPAHTRTHKLAGAFSLAYMRAFTHARARMHA